MRSNRSHCRPSVVTKARVLAKQRYLCLYCGHPFGTVVFREATMHTTNLTWDHRVPYAYLHENPETNWAAACQFCNQLKSDLHFIDLRDARRYLRQQWRLRSIEWVWIPPVSSEEDPHRWASSFATYLASRHQLGDDEDSP